MPERAVASRETRGAILLSAVAGLAALVTTYLIALRRNPDVDLWLHLAIGRQLVDGERFDRLPDPLTALADRPYLPSQWAGEVGLDRVWALGGLPAVELTRLVLVLVLVALLLTTASAVARPVAAAVAVLLTTFVTAAGWGERPQLLAFVLLAACSWSWWLARSSARAPWWLVPLTWVWACLHGTWPLAVVIGLAHVAAAFVDGRRADAIRWVPVPVLCLAAATATPLGPRLLTNPWSVGASARRVAEWQLPSATNPLLVVLVVAGLVVLWVEVRRRDEGWRGRLLLLLVTLGLGCSAVRLLVVGGILVAPLLAGAIDRWWTTQPAPTPAATRRTWAIAGATALAIGAWLAIAQPPKPMVFGGPETALVELPQGTRVVASPALTGWVLWRAPELRLLRDLRAEVYSERTAAAYEDFLNARPGWEGYAARQRVEAALLLDDSALAQAVKAAGWQARSSESGVTLWTAPQRT